MLCAKNVIFQVSNTLCYIVLSLDARGIPKCPYLRRRAWCWWKLCSLVVLQRMIRLMYSCDWFLSVFKADHPLCSLWQAVYDSSLQCIWTNQQAQYATSSPGIIINWSAGKKLFLVRSFQTMCLYHKPVIDHVNVNCHHPVRLHISNLLSDYSHDNLPAHILSFYLLSF